jgi:type VI secretion system protein
LTRSARYTLRITVGSDANEGTPVPVDLVFVWDKAVAGKVAALTAADWFATKVQFRQDDPDERSLTICEWEWVPGQAVPDINLAVPAAARKWARGVFVFANYRSPGAHRASVTPGAEAILALGRDDLSLRSMGNVTSQQSTVLDEACPTRK